MNKLSTICPHFGPCSGCTHAFGLPPIWEEISRFLKDPELVIGALRGWRAKAKLAVNGTQIGLYRAGTHDIEPIPNCFAHHPSINLAVELVKQMQGIHYIQCFVELITQKVQLALVAPEMPKNIPQSDLWHSVWVNLQPNPTNTIFGKEWIHLSGEPFLWQTLCGRKFPYHPAAFAQAHWTLFEKLAAQVVDWVPAGSRLLELYAGIGAMGILAEPKCRSVDLVENNPFAYLSFQQLKTAARYHLTDAKAMEADCIILDPPRKGVDRALLQKLDAERIIYVSCDFTSFQRDANLLFERGWRIAESKGYLLFPGTNHVEIAALFIKG